MPPLSIARAAAALAALPITETLEQAVAAGATRLANAIRAELDTTPGGPHDHPWRQTGTLQASIAQTVRGLTAQVGSNDPAAAAQEHGTVTIPPRPFLAPAAATLGEPIADDIAAAFTASLVRALGAA